MNCPTEAAGMACLDPACGRTYHHHEDTGETTLDARGRLYEALVRDYGMDRIEFWLAFNQYSWVFDAAIRLPDYDVMDYLEVGR